MRDYDIKSDLKQEQFQTLKLVQGDRGNKIKINVFEEGQPVNLAGCSVTAKYKRADGEVINNGIIEQEFSSDENFNINYFYAVMNSDITKVSGTLKMIFSIEKDDVKVSTFLLLADVREGIGENTGSSGGSTGGGEVSVDLSNYYKKNETYSRKEIDSQFKDIANLSLTKHTDGKVYIKKQDGTLIGDGIEVGSDTDLSKVTMSMSGQTLKLLNDGTQITSVEIPTAVITDEQLTNIIQAKIDDGTLTSITLGDNSVATKNIQDGAITIKKLSGVSTEVIDYIEYENSKITDETGEIVASEGRHVTRAYPITPGSTVYMYGYFWNYNDCQGAYYDANGNFLNTFKGGKRNFNHDIETAPEGAYFVRFTILEKNKNIFSFGNPLKEKINYNCNDNELNTIIYKMVEKSININDLKLIKENNYNKIDYNSRNSIAPLSNNSYTGNYDGSYKCFLEKGISYKTITNIATDLYYFVFYKNNQIVGTSRNNSDIFDSYKSDYVDYVYYYTFTLPTNLDYDTIIFVNDTNQEYNDTKIVIAEESQFGLYNDDYMEYVFVNDKVTEAIKNIKEKNKKEIPEIEGKVCIAMGDSYTAGMKSQLLKMCTKFNMVIDNRGIVSSSICGNEAGDKGFQPMWQRTETLCREYTAEGGYTIGGTSYTADDVKVILFMGGANDGFGKETWIGSGINDTNNEHIYGAMHTILNNFRKTFKNAKIIVTLQPSSFNRNVSSITDDTTAQKLGFTDLAELQKLDDYQFSNYAMFVKEKAVKEVAEFYNCKIVDCCFNWHSVLNELDRPKYWQEDKLHLTNTGYQEVVDAEEKAIIEVYS